MDPEQALKDAQTHAAAGAGAEARAALDAYRAWRRSGGFQPPDGDARAERIEAALDDLAERLRRARLAELNAEPGTRADLESRYGQVWDTDQLRQDYTVIGFAAPFVVVVRRSDGVKGSLEFQHHPRLYFNFERA